MNKDVMKLALEALENCTTWHLTREQFDKNITAITAIKQALAAPVQEPLICKHEWFSTGAMEPGECRCIKCGAWNT
jgi:hypothetical protein